MLVHLWKLPQSLATSTPPRHRIRAPLPCQHAPSSDHERCRSHAWRANKQVSEAILQQRLRTYIEEADMEQVPVSVLSRSLSLSLFLSHVRTLALLCVCACMRERTCTCTWTLNMDKYMFLCIPSTHVCPHRSKHMHAHTGICAMMFFCACTHKWACACTNEVAITIACTDTWMVGDGVGSI